MAIYLPLINKLCIRGFDKIFTTDFVEVNLDKPLNIILGGNGLGKTTLLQCIVYALTGGTNSPAIEQNKQFRWSNEFFRGRVDKDRLSTASIMIDFDIHNHNFVVERGITSVKVVRFEFDKQKQESTQFERSIVGIGNYGNYDNFVFAVSRLLYLSENRRTLMWDYDAQTRLIMILSNDIVDESRYSELRARIKLLDSKKRHTNVRIYYLEKLKETEKTKMDSSSTEQQEGDNNYELIVKRADLNQQLDAINKKYNNAAKELREYESILKNLANEIAALTDEVRSSEDVFLNQSLEAFGVKENALFAKVLQYGICPCCGEHVPQYKEVAKQRLESGCCIVCGQENVPTPEIAIDIEAINSQLLEKISARDNVNKSIIQIRNAIADYNDEMYEIRRAIDDLGVSQSYSEKSSPASSEDDEFDESEYEILKSNRSGFESDISSLSQQADDMYARFVEEFTSRKLQLENIYTNLASEFLGKKVTLEYGQSDDRFLDIKYLIPSFDNEVRLSPEDCSEAQRFFLDIAFRLAVILLNYTVTDCAASFICETPESALDVSYVENVVKMFLGFISADNRLILSNNLQRLGLAQELIKGRNGQNTSIFDLLTYGKLSDVQKSAEIIFDIRDEIVGGLNE